MVCEIVITTELSYNYMRMCTFCVPHSSQMNKDILESFVLGPQLNFNSGSSAWGVGGDLKHICVKSFSAVFCNTH